MAGKKGQAQLQIEVATDEEWEKLLLKDGLIVVDIYSEWCGPCSAMLNNLKKIKLELGGDNLHIAQAKCDFISALKRFRNKSEPTWMFITKGKVVNLMFGANSPKLLAAIIEELDREAQAREGLRERGGWNVTTLSPEEQEVFEAEQAIEQEHLRIEEEDRQQKIRERRLAVANVVLSNLSKNGVIIVFPQAKDMVKPTLADLWEPSGLAIGYTERPVFTEAMLEELLYFAEVEFLPQDKADLMSGPGLAYLTKPSSSDFEGDVDEAVLKFIYGEMKAPPGSEESPAQSLKGYIVAPKSGPVESQMGLKPSATSISSGSSIHATPSKLPAYSRSVIHSKAMLDDVLSAANLVEEGEGVEVTGIWVPPNSLTRATAIKLLFPKVYDPIALPEPVPIPPHIAIAFDSLKRRDVFETLQNYENSIMRYGYFDSDKPGKAQLIAKTTEAYVKIRSRDPGIKLVIQLSKKKSDAWCALSQLNPTYMSHNTVDGEKECKMFFPEDYDVPEDEVVDKVVQVKKKKGRRGKKKEVAPVAGEVVEHGAEEEADEEDEEEEEPEEEHSPS
ncbi:hypothetical protein PPYR_08848 [Photinus pyralis]|uniref:Thioredoxin domain-containing protein n=1 Tax=Photinus pyralis TaxID=7054 RepID=A0A1Y1KSD8_PHOPY|nr:uncharacterized protein LOC116170138 [Photinus pyralis]KAB0797855.1 hypothetical protein PPYR_08848 [Photinus pyralis]